MIKKTDAARIKALDEKVRVAVVQAILQIIGPEHTIRITSASEEITDLQPSGQNLSLRMSIDIYPKS